MKIFGLVGKGISYSFSVEYFTKFFERHGLVEHCVYKNFDIPDITFFPQIIKKNKSISGLNVTIPYKEAVIPYLDKMSRKAEEIGAVNCIRITKKGKLKGYNTDAYGFQKSLESISANLPQKALILGTGGASKAVAYVLNSLGITFRFVSRDPQEGQFSYEQINKEVLKEYELVINCTPLGTFPNVDQMPPIDYSGFGSNHIAFDLIYNPEQTRFLQLAAERGAQTKNGYDMLVFQAQKAWEIWNK